MGGPGHDGSAPVALLTPADIRALADALGVRPTKTLGQNFVHDAGTVRRIVEAADLEPGTHVIEVGPGLGSLTLALLEAGMRVSAIEIDPVLAQRLPKTVAERTEVPANLRVIRADALEIASAADIDARATTQPWDAPTALVANLPYNVSVPVLLTLLRRIPTLTRALVMVQREVAERLVAAPGSRTYGVPSAKLAWYGDARLAGAIGRAVFWPQPHVDSALVRFDRRDAFPKAQRADTFTCIDYAFAQRRKTLRKALAPLAGSPKRAEEWLSAAGLDPTTRGEMLPISAFVRLAAAASPGQAHTVTAPGKVNLLLEAARPDERGYHPLRTVFLGLDVTETVTVTPRLASGFSVTWRGEVPAEDVPDDQNLAVRAVQAVLTRAGLAWGADLAIDKHVPIAGGMAGGSADAAAALVASSRAFGLDLTDAELTEIAASLGADVAFALRGGTAYGTRYGDHLTALDHPHTRYLALACSTTGLSTPEVFRTFDRLGLGREWLGGDLPDAWRAALADPDPQPLADLMHNDLAAAALDLRPDLEGVLAAARSAGALAAVVSGSGPTIAALARDRAHAETLAAAMASVPGVARTLVASGPQVSVEG